MHSGATSEVDAIVRRSGHGRRLQRLMGPREGRRRASRGSSTVSPTLVLALRLRRGLPRVHLQLQPALRRAIQQHRSPQAHRGQHVRNREERGVHLGPLSPRTTTRHVSPLFARAILLTT